MAKIQSGSERVRQKIRERREQEKQELRQVILTAASQLFLEQGYEGFSLRQIAERIGYSATTIYLYFKDKDDLLFALCDEGFDQFGQQLSAAAESTSDPKERIVEIGHAYVRFALANPAYYQLMFMQRADFLMGHRPGEVKPRISAFDVAQHVVQQAVDAGVLRTGDVASYFDTIWGMMHGIVALWISMPGFDVERVQRAVDIALEMMFDGLAQRP